MIRVPLCKSKGKQKVWVGEILETADKSNASIGKVFQLPLGWTEVIEVIE